MPRHLAHEACSSTRSLGQASSPGGTDAADRQLELIGYIGVGSRRIRHEHLEQPLPPPGQAGQRVPDGLVALVGEKTLVDLGPVGHGTAEFDVVVTEHDPLTRRQAAQALVACRRRQPGADAIRVLDAVNVLEQAQPRRLRDIGGVAFHQLEVRSDRPDEPRELIDQAFPCLPIPVGGTPDQLCDVGRTEILPHHRRHSLAPPSIKTRVPVTRHKYVMGDWLARS